jgi:hypothetical protein
LGLTISGRVEKFVTISPREVRLYGLAGNPIKATVQIIPEKKYAFRILEARAKYGKHIDFKLQEQKGSQTGNYVLMIENKKTEKGRYFDTVYLKTDSKLRPQINVRVYGNVSAAKPKGDT